MPAAILGPGDWLGADFLLAGDSIPYTATALIECGLAVIRKAALQEALYRQPEAVTWLVAAIQRTSVTVLRDVSRYRSANATDRLRNLLVRLETCIESESEGTIGAKRLTQEQLAKLAGSPRQQVNGALKRQRCEGLVALQDGRLQVTLPMVQLAPVRDSGLPTLAFGSRKGFAGAPLRTPSAHAAVRDCSSAA